ncbi:putative phosphatidylinositol transporter protein [Apodospora peruviana]|uniref:Phosphatidylinositol transporter protein n=1 Tax=Apodospora peruviana TaxID=516989 RepID=A0AAE0IB11_9PEZI|nr:putative phosphatidylinositol transporter protein [Apodospora peruviana]
MSGEIPAGRPGNLTPEQEEKVRRIWQLIFQVCGIAPEGSSAASNSAPSEKAPVSPDAKKRKSRMGFLKRGKKDGEASEESTEVESTPQAGGVLSGNHGDEDKYGQVKHFYDTLASETPESIRNTIWTMVKHDHPDALVLRFLRARKWDVEKALIMLISTMKWRAHEMKVDEDIMKNGDAAALEAEKNDSDPAAKKMGHDFLAQLRMGKSYVHGTDKQGRPICVVRVRLHKQGEQEEASLERYTVYLIETCRMLLQSPVDTATVVFDMTDFSMANMDYTPVKFMIKCFEANYPESLGAVLVHKSPWLFQGIWKIIRGWLDPVVASKVHFTNNVRDMEGFIPLNQIPKELDGQEDWVYSYVEPVAGENDKMKDVATRDRLLAGREALVKEYESATMQWIQNPDSAEIKAKRNALAVKLREDYWNLDPYIRARSYYDRTGVLQPGGKLNYYPSAAAQAEAARPQVSAAVVDEKANGAVPPPPAPVAMTTSADDVD